MGSRFGSREPQVGRKASEASCGPLPAATPWEAWREGPGELLVTQHIHVCGGRAHCKCQAFGHKPAGWVSRLRSCICPPRPWPVSCLLLLPWATQSPLCLPCCPHSLCSPHGLFHPPTSLCRPTEPSCRNRAPSPPELSSRPRRNQAMLFGGNPRYENMPLIGRGSPPPTVPWAPQQGGQQSS